jgi:hypothetical protein
MNYPAAEQRGSSLVFEIAKMDMGFSQNKFFLSGLSQKLK